MRWPLVFVVVSGCTCGPDRLQPSAGALSFEPASAIVLGPTPLTLRSTVPDPLTVTLTVPAPFTVSPETVALTAHGSAIVTVRVDAPQGGRFSARLDARAGARAASAALTAEVTCPPAPQCQTVGIDAKTGFCRYGFAATGTACTDPCLVNASCANGACLGDAKACADADPCTVDACETGAGCLHLRCEELDDPCRSGACTAAGCAFTPTVDGTACGPADCVEARVCVAGACTTRAVPDGTACTAPCGTGTCTNAECVLPAGTTLTAEWTQAVGPGFDVESPLPADAAGNVYWLEAGSASDRLVSVTASGFPRWAVSLGLEKRVFGSRGLMVDDARGLVFVNAPGGRLLARRLADGQPMWSRAVVDDLFLAPDVAPGDTGYLGSITGGTVLMVDAVLYKPEGGAPKREELFALDPATGKTLWKQAFSGFAAAQRDDASNGYLRVAGANGWTIVKVSPSGGILWVGALPNASEVAAVHDGRVYLRHGEALSAATGAVAFQSPFVPDDATTFGSLQYLEGEWLVSKAVAYLTLGQYAAPRRVEPQSGALMWIRRHSAYRPTDGFLTSTGLRVVLDQRHLGTAIGWVWHVSALTPAGHEAWACALPDYGWYEVEGVSLVKERLVVTGHATNPSPMLFPVHTGVAAFPLPGFAIGAGWSVTSAGSLARTHAAHPK